MVIDDSDQLVHAPATDRRDNPELGQMGPDGVANRGQLVRCLIRCSTRPACCSGDLIGTKRVFGRCTASQIASASAVSFFCRLKWNFPLAGSIRLTSCPSP